MGGTIRKTITTEYITLGQNKAHWGIPLPVVWSGMLDFLTKKKAMAASVQNKVAEISFIMATQEEKKWESAALIIIETRMAHTHVTEKCERILFLQKLT